MAAHAAGVSPPRRGWTCRGLTASCDRASFRRRSPRRLKRWFHSGGLNQPLKYATLPLNSGWGECNQPPYFLLRRVPMSIDTSPPDAPVQVMLTPGGGV